MGKLKIKKEEFPRLYAQECVIGGATNRALAEQLGISEGLMSRYAKRYASEIEVARNEILKDHPLPIKNQEELTKLHNIVMGYLKDAMDAKDTDGVLKFLKPAVEVLKTMGLTERVGLTQNKIEINIANLTQEQLALAIQPIVPIYGRIIIKYVPEPMQNQCRTEIDAELSLLGVKA